MGTEAPAGGLLRTRDAQMLALIGGATFLETYAGLLPGEAVVGHCLAHHTPAAWRATLADAEAACWVAQAAGGAPVGYGLLCRPDLPGSAAGDLELRRIYLLRAWQGGGRGRALLGALCQQARDRAAPRLLLGVWARNAAALAFYAHMGFETIGTRQFVVGTLVCDDLVLALRL